MLPVRSRPVPAPWGAHRAPRQWPAPRRRPAWLPPLLAAPVALALTGCATLFGAFDVAPSGLRKADDRVRSLLAAGRYDAVLEQLAPSERADPVDELLRLLYEGTAAHYAGSYDVSNAAFERAALLAEERYTRSLSRTALSFVTSDRVLDYEPGPTERLMIPYYAALNRMRQGDLEGAAVEARRLAFLLQRYDDERGDADADRSLRAVLRYFTGTIFEAAGEWNDADVAYRNAAVLAGGALPWDTVPAPDALGEGVVILERGFVAHRVEESINLLLLPEEVEVFADGSGGERAELALLLAARVASHATRELYLGGDRPRTLVVRPPPDYVPPQRTRRVAEACEDANLTAAGKDTTEAQRRPKLPHPEAPPPPGRGAPGDADRRPADRSCDEETSRRANPMWLRIAWPALRLEKSTRISGGVVGPDMATIAPFALTADLSDAVARDFREQRTALLARTIARAAAKAVIGAKIEEEVSERDETTGRILGLLANLGGALLEQADTRSWHLIPGSIGLARLRLPPGEHELRLDLAGSGPPVELGVVPVRAGRITFISARSWQ